MAKYLEMKCLINEDLHILIGPLTKDGLTCPFDYDFHCYKT